MTAERLMGGGDDWIRYHVIEPHAPADDAVLGKWQDTADVMDDVLEDLTFEEGQMVVSKVAESLEYGNPLADPGMVFSFLKPELARWVTPSYQKENLWCFNVLINPRMLVDEYIVTFDFTGPGNRWCSSIPDTRAPSSYPNSPCLGFKSINGKGVPRA